MSAMHEAEENNMLQLQSITSNDNEVASAGAATTLESPFSSY